MKRLVEFLPRAKRQVVEAARWWSINRSSDSAGRWLTGIERAISSLATDAERFPLASEAEMFGLPIREFNFGLSGHPTHRVVFEIEKDKVIIYAIRHLAQADLTPDDFD